MGSTLSIVLEPGWRISTWWLYDTSSCCRLLKYSRNFGDRSIWRMTSMKGRVIRNPEVARSVVTSRALIVSGQTRLAAFLFRSLLAWEWAFLLPLLSWFILCWSDKDFKWKLNWIARVFLKIKKRNGKFSFSLTTVSSPYRTFPTARKIHFSFGLYFISDIYAISIVALDNTVTTSDN